MRPPPILPINPNSHRTNKITAIVQSMLITFFSLIKGYNIWPIKVLNKIKIKPNSRKNCRCVWGTPVLSALYILTYLGYP